MIHEFDYSIYDEKTIEDYLNSNGYAGESEGFEQDFFCEKMHGFLDEAKRCGLKYIGIKGSKVKYEIQKMPEMPIEEFQEYFTYALIKVVKSKATIRSADKLIEKSNNTIKNAFSSIENLDDFINKISSK